MHGVSGLKSQLIAARKILNETDPDELYQRQCVYVSGTGRPYGFTWEQNNVRKEYFKLYGDQEEKEK